MEVVEPPKYFRSRRVEKKDIVKPWLSEPRDPKEKWVTIIPLLGAFVGILLAALLVWDGWKSVINHDYCLVFEDDFSHGLNPDIWQAEMQLGGFGNGEFEQTTDSEENLFVDQNGLLNIRATLQDESLMDTDNIMNLGSACTSTERANCIAATDLSNGSVVPPVRSARINTKGSHHITYGRIEVTAKMPIGDWLWPAIWMMPVNDTYGPWPASGEIDILESRGNNHTYPQGGNNIASSTLHWGPDARTDAWYRTYQKRSASHTTYSDSFWIFSLEWSQKYLFTWINNRLMQVLYTPFENYLWDEANFATMTDGNGTAFSNPWAGTGRTNTPFDQPFYLILSLAVGGTNGWFEDGQAGKPWTDESPTAKREFWSARDTWYPTWTQSMQVRRVAMWQQCDGDEGVTVQDDK